MILIYSIQEYFPVIIMHGLGSHSSVVEDLNKFTKEAYPGILSWNPEIGGGGPYSTDTPIHQQCLEIQKMIKAHKDYNQFKDGFVAIGFSQGGYFWRHYTQMINDPPVKRLITFASPMAGAYDEKPGSYSGLADKIRKDPYSKEQQTTKSACALANWWRDPHKLDDFAQHNEDLAFLDNIRSYDEKRRQNFINLDRLILIGSHVDGVIYPYQSSFFGVWADNNHTKVLQYFERDEYSKDIFGLKSLHEQNKVYMYSSCFGHSTNPHDKNFFMKYIAIHVGMEK